MQQFIITLKYFNIVYTTVLHTSAGLALLSAVHNNCFRAAKAFLTLSAFKKEK